MEKKDINKLASYIKRHYKHFQRFYVPTQVNEEITYRTSIEGCIIQVSHGYEFIDILDLTEEEQKQLEEKLKCSKRSYWMHRLRTF
jgi:hypothetical protein